MLFAKEQNTGRNCMRDGRKVPFRHLNYIAPNPLTHFICTRTSFRGDALG